MFLWTFDSAGESDTDRLGAWLAAALPERAVVALVGTLGAGKTHLVRSIAKAAGVDARDVVSPTFVLVQQYLGDERRAIAHFDAYRLRDDDEFQGLGPEEYFERPGWTFVEWADRVADSLPEEILRIEIEPRGATARRFELSSQAPRYGACIDKLRTLAGDADLTE
jgi:tRNA threonylcarbamoyladenosine biosynthesis protein TsaE